MADGCRLGGATGIAKSRPPLGNLGVDLTLQPRLFWPARLMSELLQRSQMLLLSGSANRPLAEEVAAHLGQPLCQVTVKR